MAARDHVFSVREGLRYRFPTHINDLVVDRCETERCEVFLVVLEPGECPPLHHHPEMEQVYYVIEGTGVLSTGPTGRSRAKVGAGKVVHIPRNMPHSVRNTGTQTLRYLAIDVFIRRKPNEPTWDSHVRNVCAQLGWDIDQIRAKKRGRRKGTGR